MLVTVSRFEEDEKAIVEAYKETPLNVKNFRRLMKEITICSFLLLNLKLIYCEKKENGKEF